MPDLIATIGADSSQFKRELRSAEAEAERAGKRIETHMGGSWEEMLGRGAAEGAAKSAGSLGSSGAIRELLVLMREIGRGNWTRIPGSISILVQRLGLLKYILTPFAGIVGAIAVAGGYAAYRFKQLADAADNDYQAFGRLHGVLEAQADALKKASEQAQDFADWLKELDNRQESLTQATEDAVRAATTQAQRQSIIDNAKQQAAELAAQTRDAAIKAEKELQENNAGIHGTAYINENRTAQRKAMELYEAVLSAQTGEEYVKTLFSKRHATDAEEANMEKTVKIDGKEFSISLTEALKKVQGYAGVDTAEENQHRLEKQLQESKKAAEKAAQDQISIDRMTAKADKIEKDKDRERSTILRGSVNSLQQVGAYAMPGQVEMLDVAKKTERNTARLVEIATGRHHAHSSGSGAKF